ncbi:MAG TPA: hypothetical protein VEZ14_13120 [Dehalococcoidia bacterium]|nr:hypothetical protein [Dehalococcoidia bacterium]
MKKQLLLVLAGALALLSTASLLAGLRHALHRREKRVPVAPESTREAERRRIREALGDMLAPPPDLSQWPEHLRPTPDMPDRDTLRRSMPRLNPPLSQTIRDERDE